MNRKLTFIAVTLFCAFAQGAWAQTYTRLTSIATIDESATYVLGIDGTGFHYDYEEGDDWGYVTLPSEETPIYYTLTKAQDGNSFTAQATIDGTTYYLQVPYSKFSMSTTTGTNTDLVIGTDAVWGNNNAVANKNSTTCHLRYNYNNGSENRGLRSYNNETGTMAYFYKVTVTPPTITAVDVEIASDATSGSIAYTVGNEPTPAGSVTTAVVTSGDWLTVTDSDPCSSPIAFSCTANPLAIPRTATVRLTYTYVGSHTVTKDVTVTQEASAIFTTVTNEAELNSAVAAYTTTYVRLGADITLSAYFSIGYDRNQQVSIDQNVTLDLNGYALQRNLNAVDVDGHVIEVHSRGTLTVTDSYGGGTLRGGWANNGGGICNYGTVNFEGGTIIDCKADQQGGGIKNNTNSTLTITGGVISGNRAPNGGGIYNNENGILNISGGTISSNTASVDGGGIVNSGTASINQASIHNNTATANGGGLWNCGTMTLGNAVTIRGNSALNGGGIYLNGGSNATLSGTTIRDNTSTVAGGILMDENTVTSLTNCTITGNNTTVYGGGGIVNYGNLTLNGSTVTGNTCASMEGGGLWSKGTVNMQGTITIQNNATLSGLTSNVYLKSGHVLTVTGAMGGSMIGITVEGNNGIVTSDYSTYNSTFIGNLFTSDLATITEFSLVGSGDLKISPRSNGIYYVERSWDDVNKKVTETLQFKATGTYTELTNTASDQVLTFENGGWYVVQGNNIVYDYINVNDNVHAHLILCDGAVLNNPKGVRLRGHNSSLSIYGQIKGTGTLQSYGTVDGTNSCPGIGNVNIGGVGAELNIYGGTVHAIGGTYCAGIGGSNGQSGLRVNIYGGNVEAQGSTYGAGIGSGYRTNGTETNGYLVNIYGGTVTAVGGQQAAGIGGGYGADGGEIHIKGGTVHAYGNLTAAGIGSGDENSNICNINGGTIDISGGHVYATGGTSAAGIGAGRLAARGNISISGGIVEVHGEYALSTHDGNGENGLTIGDDMTVTTTNTLFSTEYTISSSQRIVAVQNYQDVIIKPCTHGNVNHTAGSGCINVNCNYCLHTSTMPYTFQSHGSWNIASNWYMNLAPSTGNNVAVKARATIPDGTSAGVGNITMQAGGSITIEDGAQLKATNSVPVHVQKHIGAPSWQAIAPPVGLKCGIADAKNLTGGDYDLMRYDEASATWENQKEGSEATGFDTLESGRGYIYRCADSRNLAYRGNTVAGNVPCTLSSACADGNLAGFNLIGNPYTHNVNLNRAYYTLAADGTWQAHLNGGTLTVGQAALVHATTDGEELTFTPSGSTLGAKGYLPPLPKALCFNGDCNDSNNQAITQSSNLPLIHIDGDRLTVEGDGMLQVYDVMGRRILSSPVANGSYRLPYPGVYMVRIGEHPASKVVVVK